MHRGGTAHRREIPRDFGKGWKAKVWHFGRGPSWSVVKQCQRFKLPLGTSTCISWAVPTSGTRKLPTSAKNNSLSFFSRLSLPIDILGDGYLLLTLFVSACSLYPTDLLSETLLSLESCLKVYRKICQHSLLSVPLVRSPNERRFLLFQARFLSHACL